jgi:RNA ligase (TIGR02306 family)
MRKLATVRKISDLTPIPGADFIEVATVDGWKVVVKKGEYQVGDLTIYAEIDSWIPHSIAPFLTKEGHVPKVYNGVEGQRLKTVKLKGQISQGLLLPIDVIPKKDKITLGIGDDVSELFGVQKWEPPFEKLQGNAKGNFPTFIPKTEQERVQNIPNVIEYIKQDTWEITEKIHGQSITVFYKDGQVGVCSRNLELKETIKKRIPKKLNNFQKLIDIVLSKFKDTNKYEYSKDSLWEAAERCFLIEALKFRKFNIAIQGELFGTGIQSQTYGKSKPVIAVYDIWDIDRQEYYNNEARIKFCRQVGLFHIPVLNIATDKVEKLDDLLKLSEGKSQIDNSEREGIVFKSLTDPSKSFKVISNKWLLNEK